MSRQWEPEVPIYSYEALRKSGGAVAGVIDADTGRAARMKLRESGVYVTRLAEVRPAEPRGPWAIPRFRRPGRNRGELLAVVTRQFSTLIGAEVSIVDALAVVIDQVGDKPFEIVLRDVRERVMRGSSLADALGRHPERFGEMYVNMVRAGEASGSLSSIFDALARYGERRSALRGRVSAALIYPAVLAVVGAGVATFLVTFVVPKFALLLERAHKALPLPTVVLMSVSDFLRQDWWVLLLALAGLAALWKVLMRRETFRYRMDLLVLSAPIVGDLMRKQFIAYFATTMATLLASGIRVSEALLIARRVMENRVFAREVEGLHAEIQAGRDIASTLKRGGLFPPLVSYMIAVGERSGRLEPMLRMVADSYEREIGLSVQKMVAVIEPALVVAMAGVVAFIVAAILLPILSLSQIGF